MKKILEVSKTKTEIVKTLSKNLNTITIAYGIISENKNNDTEKLDTYEQRTTSISFRNPRKTFKKSSSENKTVTERKKFQKIHLIC